MDTRARARRPSPSTTSSTTLRTPAVSVAAVLHRLPDRPRRLAVIGHGPQAQGHAAAFAAVRTLDSTTYLVRDPARSPVPATALGTDDARDALRASDVIVCATSSGVLRQPPCSASATAIASLTRFMPMPTNASNSTGTGASE